MARRLVYARAKRNSASPQKQLQNREGFEFNMGPDGAQLIGDASTIRAIMGEALALGLRDAGALALRGNWDEEGGFH